MKHPLFICFFLIIFYSGCNTKAIEKGSDASSAKQQEEAAPKRIVLMIGDGMGISQISAGMLASDKKLNLESFPFIGLIKTNSSDNIITDSAAGATAFSTGKKTYNNAIGVDADTTSVETILEIAGKGKYATGLVATSSITHATPASFFAHQPLRSMNESIAMDMLSAPVNIFIGGGKDYFENRTDKANLLDSLVSNGFEIYDGIAEIPSFSDKKIGAFIGEKEPPSMLLGRKNVLSQATKKALDYLSHQENFFLMIEGSQIDWEGHGNNSEGIIAEMKDFDEAIGVVLEKAREDGDILVIVTADHETGGYSILGEDSSGKLQGGFSTKGHTGTMIPVFAYGPGAEKFAGIYENTEIFDKMMTLIEKQE